MAQVQVCYNENLEPIDINGWKDMFFCISPISWAYLGVAIALGFSIIGAAW